MVIPYDQVPEESLNAILESFVLRSGTDYGLEEVSLPTRVAQIRKQLQTGEVLLVFDAESETCSLITATSHSKEVPLPSLPKYPEHSSSGDLE